MSLDTKIAAGSTATTNVREFKDDKSRVHGTAFFIGDWPRYANSVRFGHFFNVKGIQLATFFHHPVKVELT